MRPIWNGLAVALLVAVGLVAQQPYGIGTTPIPPGFVVPSGSGGGGGTSLTIGSTAISGGTSGRVLYDNAGTLGEMTTSGSGTQLALTTSPTFVTPTLGVATATSVDATGGNVKGIWASPFSSITRTTMSGTLTLTSTSTPYQNCDPNGSDRQITLPTNATGLAFSILHVGTANTITVKDASTNTVGTLVAGQSGLYQYDGTAWTVR